MGFVTINGVSTYEVYGDLPGALIYLRGVFQPGARAFVAAAPDDQGAMLVSARIMLDEDDWQGAATLVSTTLQWPRTGVIDKNGSTVSSATVPVNVINGEYELAAAIAADPSIYASIGGNPIRSFRDGPTNVSYFRPPGGTSLDSDEYPLRVARLVNQYLIQSKPRSTSYQNDGETNQGNFGDSTFAPSVMDDTYKKNGPL